MMGIRFMVMSLLLLLPSAGHSHPVHGKSGAPGTMMRALFGDALPLSPQRHSVVRIGTADVTVGEAPDYVQARDVFTREFWITGIRHVLERIFLVTSSTSSTSSSSSSSSSNRAGPEKMPDPDEGIMDQEAAKKLMAPEAKKILDPEAKKILDPEAKKILDPEAKKILDPEAKKILDPEAKKLLDPEGKKLLDPEAKKTLESDTSKASNNEPNKLEVESDNSPANRDVMAAARNEVVMATVQRQVEETMAEIRTRDWTDDELQALFWILHELIESGGIQIEGGKITINGEDYTIRDIISQCCPIG